jgi:hypothetical protein
MWKARIATHPVDAPKPSKLLSKTLLLAGATVTVLAALEFVARVVGWGGMVEFEPSDDWGLLMRPRQRVWMYGVPVEINSMGLRGPELQNTKARGEKRVVFLGDSITYGGGRIGEKQLFCRVVEARARAEGISIESVNLSAPSWSPQNWIGYVNKRGLHDPDAVVPILPECDLSRGFSRMNQAGLREKAPMFRLQTLALRLRAMHFQARAGAEQSPSGGRQKEVAANLSAIDHLKQKCRGIPLLVVLVPSEIPARPDKDLWPVYMPQLGELLDLREPLQDPKYFLDGVHLNVLGNEFVGERILPRLRELLRSELGAGRSNIERDSKFSSPARCSGAQLHLCSMQ